MMLLVLQPLASKQLVRIGLVLLLSSAFAQAVDIIGLLCLCLSPSSFTAWLAAWSLHPLRCADHLEEKFVPAGCWGGWPHVACKRMWHGIAILFTFFLRGAGIYNVLLIYSFIYIYIYTYSYSFMHVQTYVPILFQHLPIAFL